MDWGIVFSLFIGH